MQGKAIQAAKKQIRKILPYSPVVWANFGPVSHFIACSIPSASPPILVISIPRSGSSWVGKFLGMASDALYLREPISQSYLQKAGLSPVIFEVNVAEMPQAYKAFGASAFRGLPVFPNEIVKHPHQWVLSERRSRNLVIKEVNPLALDWIIQDYRPKVIYLVRHPAAVAYSFFRLGWTTLDFRAIFSQQTLASENLEPERFAESFWAGQGAFQAIVLKRALKLLEGYKDYTIVRFEDLCTRPTEIFRRLYEFCGFHWNANLDKEIQRHSTSSKQYRVGGYDLERNSAAMINRWTTEIPEETLAQIRETYLFYNPPLYGPEEWTMRAGLSATSHTK
jgi:hypothetical protein